MKLCLFYELQPPRLRAPSDEHRLDQNALPDRAAGGGWGMIMQRRSSITSSRNIPRAQRYFRGPGLQIAGDKTRVR